MTSEEMERAIEFLLKSQATLEGQIAETNRVVSMLATSQSEVNATLARAISELATAQGQTEGRLDRLAETVGQTEGRLDRLAETVERFISEGGKR
jgi:hypothetical protein